MQERSNDVAGDANVFLGDAKQWMRRKRRLVEVVIIAIGDRLGLPFD
jgi:hypothetical protein